MGGLLALVGAVNCHGTRTFEWRVRRLEQSKATGTGPVTAPAMLGSSDSSSRMWRLL